MSLKALLAILFVLLPVTSLQAHLEQTFNSRIDASVANLPQSKL